MPDQNDSKAGQTAIRIPLLILAALVIMLVIALAIFM
jgi:hypothetical protein